MTKPQRDSKGKFIKKGADNGTPIIKGFKGYDRDMKCRDFQFVEGLTYEHTGKVKACESGFHFCEYPLDVFSYYPPGTSTYTEVEARGDISRHGDDTKVATSKLTVKASIGIPGMIKAAIEYTMSRVKATNTTSNSGTRGAASNSGDYGAASNSGTRGAASNSGDYGAASNSGTRGAASNSGTRGAASNSGKDGIAAAYGYEGKAKSDESGAIVLVHRNNDYEIVHIRASKVGENGIKADTWYMLNEAGEFVECEA